MSAKLNTNVIGTEFKYAEGYCIVLTINEKDEKFQKVLVLT